MSPPKLYLVDGIGPFFRATRASRINWSKIPFSDLPEDSSFWRSLHEDFAHLAERVAVLGYTGVTLDDLAHLTPHPAHDSRTNRRLEFLASHFRPLFEILRQHGLTTWITSDVLSLSPRAAEVVGASHHTRNAYYRELVERFFGRFPSVQGLILRIGESDGTDVREPLRSHLHLRSARQTNRFLRDLLPLFDRLDRHLILRTWTVGAHRVGDLIWHRARLQAALRGLKSPNFILSMKPGESDFFRHLPLNHAFFRYQGPKILELQARREYEGAGEIPSFAGYEAERLAHELTGVQNLVGISVWVQPGGWHRFRRLAFLDSSALWIELNARVIVDVFKRQLSPEQSFSRFLNPEKTAAAAEFFHHTDYVFEQLYYIPEFSRLNLYFRRTRIPPLLHLYWDSLFIYSPLRKILRFFVHDHAAAMQQSEGALARFPRIIELAEFLGWPVEDILFMRDTCELLALARQYYFSPYSEDLVDRIKEAKARYKMIWPSSQRPRYRVKTAFHPPRLRRRTIAWASHLLLRRRRNYRPVLDRLFTLNVLSLLYRLFRKRSQKSLPKFVRKSAMGIDTLFE